MIPQEQRMCSNCKLAVMKDKQLHCHLNPPDKQGAFPIVQQDDWCSRWQDKDGRRKH